MVQDVAQPFQYFGQAVEERESEGNDDRCARGQYDAVHGPPESIEQPAGNLNRYLFLSASNVKPPRTTSTAPGKNRLRACAAGMESHTRTEEWNTADSAREVQTEWSQAKFHVGKILIHFCDRIPQQKGHDDPLRQRLANEAQVILPWIDPATEKELSSPSLREVDLNLTCMVPVVPAQLARVRGNSGSRGLAGCLRERPTDSPSVS